MERRSATLLRLVALSRLRCLRDTPPAAGGRARDALATPARALAPPGGRPAPSCRLGVSAAPLSRAPRAVLEPAPAVDARVHRIARAASASSARPPSPPHPADARPEAVRGAAHPERRPAAPLRPRPEHGRRHGRPAAADATARCPTGSATTTTTTTRAGRSRRCTPRTRSTEHSTIPARAATTSASTSPWTTRSPRLLAPPGMSHRIFAVESGEVHYTRRGEHVAQLQRPPLRDRPLRLLARLSLVGRGHVRPCRRHDRLDLSQRMARAPLRVGARERPARVGQSAARGRQAPAVCRPRGTRDPGRLRLRSA